MNVGNKALCFELVIVRLVESGYCPLGMGCSDSTLLILDLVLFIVLASRLASVPASLSVGLQPGQSQGFGVMLRTSLLGTDRETKGKSGVGSTPVDWRVQSSY